MESSPQVPLSMGFSREEYWSGLPFPSPGDLPNPGIAPRSPVLQEDSLPSEPPGKPCEEGGVKHIYVTDTILSDTKPAQLQPTVL